jgi:class 3 adenylate cyclase
MPIIRDHPAKAEQAQDIFGNKVNLAQRLQRVSKMPQQI